VDFQSQLFPEETLLRLTDLVEQVVFDNGFRDPVGTDQQLFSAEYIVHDSITIGSNGQFSTHADMQTAGVHQRVIRNQTIAGGLVMSAQLPGVAKPEHDSFFFFGTRGVHNQVVDDAVVRAVHCYAALAPLNTISLYDAIRSPAQVKPSRATILEVVVPIRISGGLVADNLVFAVATSKDIVLHQCFWLHHAQVLLVVTDLDGFTAVGAHVRYIVKQVVINAVA